MTTVSDITQNSVAASSYYPATTVASTPFDLSSLVSAVQSGSVSSGTTAASGTTNPFQQLSNDLQAMLVQLQNDATTSSSAAAVGSSGTASTSTTGAVNSASTSAGTSQARPHHHHHGEAQAMNGADRLQTDASRLLNDLTGGTTASNGLTPSGSSTS